MKKLISGLGVVIVVGLLLPNKSGEVVQSHNSKFRSIEEVIVYNPITQNQQKLEKFEQILKERNERIRLEELKKQKELAEKKRLEELRLEKLQKQRELESKKYVTVSRGNESNIAYEAYFEETFYTNNQESTGKNAGHPLYGVTASGTTTREGVTVACPRNIELGTKVHIDGFGYRVCQDRGGAINNSYKLDIYVESVDKAIQLGRQKLIVRVFSN